MIAVWEGGLAIHGGLIGGTIAGVLYARKHKLGVFKWLTSLLQASFWGRPLEDGEISRIKKRMGVR